MPSSVINWWHTGDWVTRYFESVPLCFLRRNLSLPTASAHPRGPHRRVLRTVIMSRKDIVAMDKQSRKWDGWAAS